MKPTFESAQELWMFIASMLLIIAVSLYRQYKQEKRK